MEVEGWVKGVGGSLGLVGGFLWNESTISSIFHHLLFAIIYHIYLSHFSPMPEAGQGFFVRLQDTFIHALLEERCCKEVKSKWEYLPINQTHSYWPAENSKHEAKMAFLPQVASNYWWHLIIPSLPLILTPSTPDHLTHYYDQRWVFSYSHKKQ